MFRALVVERRRWLDGREFKDPIAACNLPPGPALMILIGKINWYIRRWLDRVVPRVSIEGAEFFEQRDAVLSMPHAEPTPTGAAAA